MIILLNGRCESKKSSTQTSSARSLLLWSPAVCLLSQNRHFMYECVQNYCCCCCCVLNSPSEIIVVVGQCCCQWQAVGFSCDLLTLCGATLIKGPPPLRLAYHWNKTSPKNVGSLYYRLEQRIGSTCVTKLLPRGDR